MYSDLNDLQADLQDCLDCLRSAKDGSSEFLIDTQKIYGDSEFEEASLASHQADNVRYAAQRLLNTCEYEMRGRRQELIDYGYEFLDYLEQFWTDNAEVLKECEQLAK